jgi:hypothetical protein
MTEGLRYDADKIRMDLIPHEWMFAVSEVMTEGSKKYEPRNWELGMHWSKCWGPLLRHAFKWLRGERYDPETGCHHLAMVAWNALALMSYELRELGKNDLPRYQMYQTRVSPGAAQEMSPIAHEIRILPQEIPEEGVVSEKFSEPKMETLRDPLKVDGATFVNRKKSVFGGTIPTEPIKPEVEIPIWHVERGVELANDYELGTQFDGPRLGIGEGMWKILSKRTIKAPAPEKGRGGLWSYDMERVS